jgi:hypothetical protein
LCFGTLFLVFLFSGAHLAFAEKTDNLRFYIYGNKIYDDDTIMAEAGLTYATLSTTETEIRDRLLSTGFFSRVRVSISPGRVEIVVIEKQSAFLLPYFASSSERKVFGVAGGVTGISEKASELLARYQIGNGDHEGAAFYRDDFILDGFVMLGGSLVYQDALHDVYSGRDVAYSFGNREIDFTVATGYHLDPDLFLGFDSHFEIHRFEGVDGAEVRGDQVSHRIFTEIGSLFQNEGLTHGFIFKPYVEFTNPLSTFSFVQWGILGRFSFLRRGNLNWVVTPRWEAGQGLPRYQLFEIGGPRLRGFPSQNFRSDHYSSVQNDIMFASFGLGGKLLVRPLAFADWAYVENGGRPGLGLGVNVYFRHVSVPAIQIDAGYGFHPNGFSVAASIGPQI